MPLDLIKPYDPRWDQSFRQLHGVLLDALRLPSETIQHVGSTAIPDLPAKPILDIDIIVPDRDSLRAVEAGLVALGYRSRGEQGVPGRFAFRPSDETVPRTDAHAEGSRRIWMSHHLYVCLEDSLALRNHLCFRDALLADPAKAEAYGRLKWSLVQQPDMDRESYARAKTSFVLLVLAASGFDAAELEQIAAANR